VSDVVWTTLITGGTAVLTGGLGWLGARQHTHVELLKLKQERDPGTAENLKFRQELYLRYLELTDAVWRFTSSGDGTYNGFYAAFAVFARADDEMELFAAERVIPARDAMWDAAWALIEGTDAGDAPDDATDSDERFMENLRNAREPLKDDWNAARVDLVQAVREDVGPDL
jgi:hypothetical protein